MKKLIAATTLAAALAGFASGMTVAQTVKITPLGSHDGEFCTFDRALLFEDPNGTTILYDAGRTVRGPTDPRLPAGLDLVLLSSSHVDHLGDRHAADADAGSCGSPAATVQDAPSSNTARIVASSSTTKVLVGLAMGDFLRNQVVAAQVDVLHFGASRIVGGVKVAVVGTVHSNNLDPSFLTSASHSVQLSADGLNAYVGPTHGYILQFTNGLVVYLSGDTGHTSDMKLIVKDFYKPNLAVMNIGNNVTMGPDEAAWAVNKLIKPKSVIASHADEAATLGGAVLPGTKTQSFADQVSPGIAVHVPTSGDTMGFNGNGKCVSGAC